MKHFASTVDPREDIVQWRQAADGAPTATVSALEFSYGMKGPAGLDRVDHFGTIAETTLTFPPGAWRLRSTSDDGIQVWLDGELVIDDWTWHAPRTHVYRFTIEASRSVDLRVEHFELDGFAVLQLDIERDD